TIETDSTSAFSIPTDAGVTAEGDARTSGSMVLGYTADDTTITYTEVVSAEGTTTFTINGESNEVDLAETAALMTERTYDYTCTDAELTLTSEIPGLGRDREQTLTRSPPRRAPGVSRRGRRAGPPCSCCSSRGSGGAAPPRAAAPRSTSRRVCRRSRPTSCCRGSRAPTSDAGASGLVPPPARSRR